MKHSSLSFMPHARLLERQEREKALKRKIFWREFWQEAQSPDFLIAAVGFFFLAAMSISALVTI